MKKLDVLLINQAKKSSDCHIVCLQMILNYFGDVVSFDQLNKAYDEFRDGDLLHSQGAAIYLARHGYDVNLIVRDLAVVDSSIDEKIDENKLELLKDYLQSIPDNQENKYKRSKLMVDIKAIESGVKYSNATPSSTILQDAIDQGKPVIVSIRNSAIEPNPSSQQNHSVLIVGYDENNYLINNPGWQFDKPQLVRKEKIVMGWYMIGARTIIAYK